MSLHRLDRKVQLAACERINALIGSDAKAMPFLLDCVTSAPEITVAGALRPKHMPPTTWFMRFANAGLPSPTWYLKQFRLVRLRAIADDYELSMQQVGGYLGFESQSQYRLHRHLTVMLGMTASEFRLQTTTDGLLSRFMLDGVASHAQTLRRFDPAVNRRVRAADDGRTVAA